MLPGEPFRSRSSFGAYRIDGLLGAGGMGEVYRAHDTALNRDVALKVLPESFARDPDRLARFKREAQVLAGLNHPGIGVIYGLEESDAVQALVLELIEGPTLAERISRGPIPVDEALSIARQIADAIEAAHDKAVIHRDLKPANIKVRPDGVVKVLDFGLAKVLEPDGDRAASSTITSPAATRAGLILGTAAYMSPEQAVGKTADECSDIWAFGVVLYEMLTGIRPFDGETVTEIVSGILKSEPDWTRLPAATPMGIRRVLRRCLRKDRVHRLHDIGDARIEIDDARDVPHEDDAVRTSTTRGGSRERWVLAAALVLALALAGVQSARLQWFSSAAPVAPEARLEIGAPEEPGPERLATHSLAISPDGLKIVYSALVDGRPLLWLRPLDSVTARPLAGTDSAVHPFWSPDSRSVGFFAGGQLKRIDLEGGTIRALASTPFAVGGAWSRAGAIVFGPTFAGPLYRVSTRGGELNALTELGGGERGHAFPRFLPDGHRFLYSVWGGETGMIYVGDLDGSPPRRLLDAELADVHDASNQLLFLRQGTLFAQDVDLDTLTLRGDPVSVERSIATFSASEAGTIIYRAKRSPATRQLVWYDRSGKETGRVGGFYEDSEHLAVSPDGRYVAISRRGDDNVDIWLLETTRGALSRFTSEPAANWSLIWSPDNQRVVFDSNRSGTHDLFIMSASGAGGEDLLLSNSQEKTAVDWSPDGRFVLYRTLDPVTSHDLWILPVEGDRRPSPVVRTNFVEAFGQFAPNGKWIAYQSDESGRSEVYARPFPGPGLKVPISTQGGAQMRWRRDGRELFYLGLDSRLMAVPIEFSADGETLEAGEPVALFKARIGAVVPPQSGSRLSYVVSPDGQRFLMNTIDEEPAPAPITIMLNWKPGR